MTGNPYYDSMDVETIDYLKEGFQVIDFEWRYQYLNNAVLAQSKYASKADLIGFTMMEKYPGIENTEMFSHLRECMELRVSRGVENEFKFPDGSSGWFELRIEPVPKGIVILSTDITERKREEQSRLDRIRELEDMIHMCSHRVRQPVSHILAVSELLDHKMTSQSEVHRIAEIMMESAQSLDMFTRELTSYLHEIKSRV